MSARLGAPEEALLLRHAAGLRRSGVTARQAVVLIAASLRPSDARRELEQVAAALERGEVASSASAAGMTQLLATGDRATPEVLEHAARARESELDAARAWRAGALQPMTVLIFGGAAIFAAGMISRALGQAWHEVNLPVVTEVALVAMRAFTFIGPIAFGCGILALALGPKALIPGVRGRLRAAQLRRLAAEWPFLTFEPGVDPIEAAARRAELLPLERSALAALARRRELPAALDALADELEAESQQAVDRFRHWFPAMGFVAGVVVTLLYAIVMTLPVFSLAGSIR